MKSNYWRVVLGIVLIVMGVVALFQMQGILPMQGLLIGALFAVLFAGGGVAFLSIFIQDRSKWWALLPGIIFLGLGLLITGNLLGIPFWGRIGGVFFLASISLAFWLVYLTQREFWWALIPAGILLTLALIAGLDNFSGIEKGNVLFLGIGATFALVAVLPAQREKLRWAWIPAGIMGIMGILPMLLATSAIQYVWPVLIILAGLFMIGRTLLHR
ncbi:MAG: hypothetical protein IT308_13225 [Anaerolineaceae bacterium]|nr:hypothetical protein [Anaerolineaceae bacterium]